MVFRPLIMTAFFFLPLFFSRAQKSGIAGGFLIYDFPRAPRTLSRSARYSGNFEARHFLDRITLPLCPIRVHVHAVFSGGADRKGGGGRGRAVGGRRCSFEKLSRIGMRREACCYASLQCIRALHSSCGPPSFPCHFANCKKPAPTGCRYSRTRTRPESRSGRTGNAQEPSICIAPRVYAPLPRQTPFITVPEIFPRL